MMLRIHTCRMYIMQRHLPRPSHLPCLLLPPLLLALSDQSAIAASPCSLHHMLPPPPPLLHPPRLLLHRTLHAIHPVTASCSTVHATLLISMELHCSTPHTPAPIPMHWSPTSALHSSSSQQTLSSPTPSRLTDAFTSTSHRSLPWPMHCSLPRY